MDRYVHFGSDLAVCSIPTMDLWFLILFTLFREFIADLLMCWTFRHVFGRTNIS